MNTKINQIILGKKAENEKEILHVIYLDYDSHIYN